jgi:phosphatidylethanolamine/phosphatidyl-N-methylethanolamine N-methyltransferase
MVNLVQMGRQTDFFYNRFSFLYPLIDVFLKPQKKVLFNEINELPEGNLLEIGVGNGTHFKLYKKHKIIGIDTSATMLKGASKRCSGKIKLLKMDGEALLFDNDKFDYIVLSHVVAVVDDPEQLMKEVLRVLKPQGQVFILNHFTPGNWLKYIDRTFSTVSKALHFKSVFHIEEIAVIKQMTLLKEVKLGLTSYFKILIYRKN